MNDVLISAKYSVYLGLIAFKKCNKSFYFYIAYILLQSSTYKNFKNSLQ